MSRPHLRVVRHVVEDPLVVERDDWPRVRAAIVVLVSFAVVLAILEVVL